MAIETFIWPDDEADVDGTLRTRTSQFGDGYAQESGDGLNGESQSWSLTFGGLPDEVGPILDFIRRHKGYRSFLWTRPAASWACKARRTASSGALARSRSFRSP